MVIPLVTESGDIIPVETVSVTLETGEQSTSIEVVPREEFVKLMEENQKLMKESASNQQKLLQFENAASTGINLKQMSIFDIILPKDRGAIITAVTDAVNETLDIGLRKFETDLASKVALEVRSELSRFYDLIPTISLHFPPPRQADTILREITPLALSLNKHKENSDTGVDILENINGFLGELSAKMDLNHQAVTTQNRSLSNLVSPCKDSITQTRTQLGSMFTVLNNVLKVISHKFNKSS